jgi:pimeloyl-ACP methyl ester carboxylesterase
MGESRFIAAQDGLKLHALEWGDRQSPLLPVVCLPGLTRTAEDFTTLAAALAADRRVLALDYRGRGRSDYDPNPEHYAIPVEAADVMTVLSVLSAAPAVVVGTSRGGLIAMTLAAAKPDALLALSFYRDGCDWTSGKIAMRSPRTEPSQSSLATWFNGHAAAAPPSPRDELTPPHRSSPEDADWAAYRGQGRMSGLEANISRSFLQRGRRVLAHSGAALVGGMSAAGESRQPTVDP